MPAIGVLIKPSSSKCNLRCRYCFYHSVAKNRLIDDFGFMSEETIDEIIRKTLSFADGLATFSFQGGEPMLRGLDFYRKVVLLQHKHNVKGVKIENCLQTNGMLIDDEWADFLKENNFLVGVSLDGPEHLHDLHRVDAAENGTFQRVMDAIERMKRRNVRFNILFVVTEGCAKAPDKVYRFFKRRDFRYLQFIPCIDPIGRLGEEGYSLSNESYGEFLTRMFRLWSQDLRSGREVSVRFFDNVVRMALNEAPETCSMTGCCRCQFVFEADGSVYPCDFYTTDRWRIGNIHNDELMDMASSGICREFIEGSMVTAKECGDCRWRYFCRGGCRRDRDENLTGESALNRYCGAYRYFYENCYDDIIKTAKYVAGARGGGRL